MKKANRLSYWDPSSAEPLTAAGFVTCAAGVGAIVVCALGAGGTAGFAGLGLLGEPNDGQVLNLVPELRAEVASGLMTPQESDAILADLARVGISEFKVARVPVVKDIEASLNDSGFEPKTSEFIARVVTR